MFKADQKFFLSTNNYSTYKNIYLIRPRAKFDTKKDIKSYHYFQWFLVMKGVLITLEIKYIGFLELLKVLTILSENYLNSESFILVQCIMWRTQNIIKKSNLRFPTELEQLEGQLTFNM